MSLEDRCRETEHEGGIALPEWAVRLPTYQCRVRLDDGLSLVWQAHRPMSRWQRWVIRRLLGWTVEIKPIPSRQPGDATVQ